MDANESLKSACDSLYVSIHAPVMDAKTVDSKFLVDERFNPRARDGREDIFTGVTDKGVFQSTRP